MKKFSLLNEDVKTKYELKDSLRNEIYSIIENSIFLKFTNEKSLDSNIDITGKEELVEKIKNLIDDVRIKERTFTLETVKANVHRNFDMNWLNEQINNLKKIKVGSDFVLFEEIKDSNVDTQNKAEILNYFSKKLNENKKFGDFEFDYEPSDGIFKFVNDTDDVVVKATPFFNDENGFPIEVFDSEQSDSHIFIEQREFNVNEILFNKYRDIMENFLVNDVDNWMKKVDKFDKNSDIEEVDNEVPNGMRNDFYYKQNQ